MLPQPAPTWPPPLWGILYTSASPPTEPIIPPELKNSVTVYCLHSTSSSSSQYFSTKHSSAYRLPLPLGQLALESLLGHMRGVSSQPLLLPPPPGGHVRPSPSLPPPTTNHQPLSFSPCPPPSLYLPFAMAGAESLCLLLSLYLSDSFSPRWSLRKRGGGGGIDPLGQTRPKRQWP